MRKFGTKVCCWPALSLLQVFSISLGGTITETSFAMSGSGSTYINGFVDKYWREGMSEQEAMDFVTKALRWVGGGECLSEMNGVGQVGCREPMYQGCHTF